MCGRFWCVRPSVIAPYLFGYACGEDIIKPILFWSFCIWIVYNKPNQKDRISWIRQCVLLKVDNRLHRLTRFFSSVRLNFRMWIKPNNSGTLSIIIDSDLVFFLFNSFSNSILFLFFVVYNFYGISEITKCVQFIRFFLISCAIRNGKKG